MAGGVTGVGGGFGLCLISLVFHTIRSGPSKGGDHVRKKDGTAVGEPVVFNYLKPAVQNDSFAWFSLYL